ncbi:hypothetical protein [Gellertiella hungarica]|uniref:Uncharacterized protein n=1 Tax=Gellertiella hungarica TaxID=1572859 RepID=A0A7W6J2S7_9HYPH|nr:hypothetical protein [Gellertiella hungarica]MBB4063703.1 hypothetical protein [Gellertiella hungarica]
MENGKAAIELKYKWRKTWPEHPDDYVGYDPNCIGADGKPEVIGRFYISHLPEGMGWRWFSQWRPLEFKSGMPSGVERTEREAAKAVEEAYEYL